GFGGTGESDGEQQGECFTGCGWFSDNLFGREGRDRAGDDFERREMGTRSAQRRALEQQGPAGQPGLASGRSARVSGDTRWKRAGDRRLRQKGKAAQRRAEKNDRNCSQAPE